MKNLIILFIKLTLLLYIFGYGLFFCCIIYMAVQLEGNLDDITCILLSGLTNLGYFIGFCILAGVINSKWK